MDRFCAGVLVLVCCALGIGCAPPRSARSVAAPTASAAFCVLPVDAAVSDGFRPPSQPWLPGNRGLSFATEPGQPVEAVQPGVVQFAGPIAHEVYVTVQLDDGRDVTYSYLSSATVAVGDKVGIGDVVGFTGSVSFQLGYRDGSQYLDPTGLVTAACGWHHAVLVAVPE